MPKTALGKWSVRLIVIMPILFLMAPQFINWFYEDVSAGETILEDITTRPLVSLTMLTGMAAGVTAFFTGIIPIIKKKEKGFLVYISTILGALTIVYLILEFSSPH